MELQRVPSWEGARERQAERVLNRKQRRSSILPALNLKSARRPAPRRAAASNKPQQRGMARGQQQQQPLLALPRPTSAAGAPPPQARLSPQKNSDLKRAMREGERRKSPVPAIDAKSPIKAHVPVREKRRALEARETNTCSEKAMHDDATAAKKEEDTAAQRAEVKQQPEVMKCEPPAAPADGVSGAKGWNEEDIKAALDHHNELRARHGAPPLKWKESLAEDAQKAANQCVKKGQLHHSNHAGAGQNGAMGYGSFRGAIDGWYSEISDYDFDKAGFTMGTGHFTQVVWKSCTHVGMARDTTGSGRYMFANYYPPGNYMGRFPAEVQKPK